MTVESIVRIAGPADHREIWRLILQGHKEIGTFPLSPDKVQWFMTRALAPHLIAQDDTGVRGVIGVIGPEGSLEGMAFLLISEFWYTHNKHLEEILVYVDPEHRKSGNAKALIDWMKDQSIQTKLKLVTGIFTMSDKTEAKCRLYRRSLPKAGEFFIYSGA
jgi:GNAT superfamily N-acetyltransferase